MVEAHIKNHFAVEFTARSHHRIADVREDWGGHNEGPSPHELLEAALATCTTMTVQMYAQRKNWPLQTAEVQVRILRENPDVLIETEIGFRGDLTEDQKKRLFEIACKCPIHRILERKITVENKFIPSSEDP